MKLDFFKKDKKIRIKREREKHITRLHLILFFIVVIGIAITFIVIKTNNAKRIKKYKTLEENLNIATVYYYGNKTSELEKGETKIIKMKTLIDNGYLQDEITNQCVGYTAISKYKDIDGRYQIGYNSYIKCGEFYKTIGFEQKNLDD